MSRNYAHRAGPSGTLLVPPRSLEPEILDGTGQTAEELEQAFAGIRKVNRFLGGISGVLRPLRALAGEDGLREFSVLDVGTGAADIPLAIQREAAARGWRVRCAGIEIHPLIARLAAREGGPTGVLRGDARRMPFADGSFDVVAASLFLHHFDDRAAAALLREFGRVARLAVIVNDLARHRIPWLAIRAIGFAFRAGKMFRHDGPLSVLRGFTRDELFDIARRAGLGDAGAPGSTVSVTRRMPWRLVLVARIASREPITEPGAAGAPAGGATRGGGGPASV